MDILQLYIYPYTRDIQLINVLQKLPTSHILKIAYDLMIEHVNIILMGYMQHYYDEDGTNEACKCHDLYAANWLMEIYPNILIDELLAIICRVRWLDYNCLTLKNMDLYRCNLEDIIIPPELFSILKERVGTTMAVNMLILICTSYFLLLKQDSIDEVNFKYPIFIITLGMPSTNKLCCLLKRKSKRQIEQSYITLRRKDI